MNINQMEKEKKNNLKNIRNVFAKVWNTNLFISVMHAIVNKLTYDSAA